MYGCYEKYDNDIKLILTMFAYWTYKSSEAYRNLFNGFHTNVFEYIHAKWYICDPLTESVCRSKLQLHIKRIFFLKCIF